MVTKKTNKKEADHHCCRNKKQKWILKSRGREKIIMQYAQLYQGLGIWLKITFSSIMSLLLPQSVQNVAWKCNVQSRSYQNNFVKLCYTQFYACTIEQIFLKKCPGILQTSSGKFLFWHTNFTYRTESLDNWNNS